MSKSNSKSVDWRMGAERDPQSVTPSWEPSDLELIEGVSIHEIKNVLVPTGTLTEIYRSEWEDDAGRVAQVFQRTLRPGCFTAWHAHANTLDRLFVGRGVALLVLFDARPESPTRGQLNEVPLGVERPSLVTVPPKVWHGVKNIGDVPATIINCVDQAYDYELPDHWRLASSTSKIPYRFE